MAYVPKILTTNTLKVEQSGERKTEMKPPTQTYLSITSDRTGVFVGIGTSLRHAGPVGTVLVTNLDYFCKILLMFSYGAGIHDHRLSSMERGNLGGGNDLFSVRYSYSSLSLAKKCE